MIANQPTPIEAALEFFTSIGVERSRIETNGSNMLTVINDMDRVVLFVDFSPPKVKVYLGIEQLVAETPDLNHAMSVAQQVLASPGINSYNP